MCQACPPVLPRRLLLGGLASLPALRARAADPPSAVGADATLRRLMAGNARYAANRASAHDFDAGRAARARAQHPIAAILGCADSRVPPELVFDQGPGDLFVVRVAGNVLTDDGIASLEFATQTLGVRLIMVLGHTGCGAVAAAIQSAQDGTTLPGHLPWLIARIAPAVAATQSAPAGDRLAATIDQNVKLTAQQTGRTAPLLSASVASGKVRVVGGVYDLATGQVGLLAPLG
jgi:carbonic anhydrase